MYNLKCRIAMSLYMATKENKATERMWTEQITKLAEHHVNLQ